MKVELASLEQQTTRLTEQVEARQERKQQLDEETASLVAREAELQTRLEALQERERELRHVDLPRQERMGALLRPCIQPVVHDGTLAPSDEPGGQETAWLQAISKGIGQAGYEFPDRILRAFHTSLKCAAISPITVLAGISGTGKSQLPRLYADLGGIHFLNIAVQPAWDSPEDLFGFFNYTDGRFRATELSRALFQVSGSDSPASLRDELLIVLLDEMNIARVEHYFSELLSKLETRRGLTAGGPGWRRGAVALDAGGAGSSEDGAGEELLFLDHNVLFVGTMNEDESTLTLSDKVKDRASIITFPSPASFREVSIQEPDPRGTTLPRTTWESWCDAARVPAPAQQQRVQELVAAFNTALGHVGRAVGHRVFQSVSSYVAAYPEVGGREQAFDDAVSDVFAQKLIPKLVGIETRAARGERCLKGVAQLLPSDLREAFEQARSDEYFNWAGSREMFAVPSATEP